MKAGIPSLSAGWCEVILFNLVCDRVEDQSREKAKANPTYCATISHGMRIVRLRRSKKNRGKHLRLFAL